MIEKKIFNEFRKFVTKDIAILDCETTGLDKKKDEIVQLYACRIHENGSRDELSWLFKPSFSIPKEASDIHGITNEMVKDAPSFGKIAPTIHKFFDGVEIIAGYNSSEFDIDFIVRQMEEAGFPKFLDGVYHYDALSVYRQHSTRKLADAVKFYTGQAIEDAHTADGDVKSTIMVITAQLEKEQSDPEGVYKKLNLTQRNDLSRFILVDDKGIARFNFTKNKGMALEDSDSGFIFWIYKQDFVPQEVKTYIKDYLANVKNKRQTR